MNEKELVGIFAKNFLRHMCRKMPFDEEIRHGSYPYSDAQMEARKGVTFTHDFCSAYTSASSFLMELDGVVKGIGHAVGKMPAGFEVLIDASKVPNHIVQNSNLPDNILREAFCCYFDLMYQDDNWAHQMGCYQEIMTLAAKNGYAQLHKLDSETVKLWADTGRDAYETAMQVAKAKLSSDEKKAFLSKWQYDSQQELYAIFDKEHGTKDGKIWIWTPKLERLLGNWYREFDPMWTGGPFS